MNRTSGAVEDLHQFRVDLEGQGLVNNVHPQHEPVWELAYSARNAYNLSSLSATAWHGVVERMRTNDALFAEWLIQFHTGRGNGTFTEKEREQTLCRILNPSKAEDANCVHQ